jgi:hypothetical protein
MKNMNRRDFLKLSGKGLAGLAVAMHFPLLTPRRALASSGAWKFGVMSDTQWSNRTTDPANPGSCAVNIIQALNQQFIHHDCKFVVQCGDLCDKESWDIPNNSQFANYVDPFGYALGTKGVRTLQYRAWAAQSLYDAGIGFWPVRGNHEASSTAANEVPALWPQTTGGGNNMFGVSNIIPSNNQQLMGLSYAFDFDNVRIMLIDQFSRKDGSASNNNDGLVDQVAWVDSVLANRSSDMHAFVVGHKNLSGQNHKDVVFGSSWTNNTATRDNFIASLDANKVGYYLGGHDHQHYRSSVTAGGKTAEQIITSSNSYKFYTPSTPYQQAGELPIADELYTIGYYIFTVDGPCVTVDFYSSSHGADYGDTDLTYSPPSYNFYLRETFGYSLNGKSFTVAHGESYNSVEDTFDGTTVRILDGSNGNTETAYGNDALVKTVKTGWTSNPGDYASAVLKLWGVMDNLSLFNANLTGLLPSVDESKQGDTYVLSLSYDPKKVRPSQLISGKFCLAAKELGGSWVNAVDLNFGGSKTFKYGPWRSTYGLGTYGVDPSKSTVWAVVNRDGDFVAKMM